MKSTTISVATELGRRAASSLSLTRISLLAFIAAGLSSSVLHAATNLVAIKAGRLIDVAQSRVLERQLILVEGERIRAIGAESSITVPSSAAVIDLQHLTVLPGLIDCHTHITSQIEDFYADTFRKSPIDFAVEAHVFARRTLEAGFTTCRDVGSFEFIDVALKRAIDSGRIPGPRLFVAGHALSATGGHGDLNGFSPYLEFKHFHAIADGPEEIRKKVRWNIKHGADLIKVSATAGVLSEEESAGAPQYSEEELRAAVAEAKMWGRKVAAHAHGTEGIKRAIRAGVASIEHGSLIDEEGVALMKEHGTFLVPTLYVSDAVLEHAAEWKLPEKMVQKARALEQQRLELLRRAIQAGVKVAYGTDAGVFSHGRNAADFRYLQRLGMSPMQAIQSATILAAELLDQTQHLGSLREGCYADIIAVTGDPLQDLAVLEQVRFVMKGGVVFKSP